MTVLPPTRQGQNRRVLVIDPDPEFRQLLGTVLGGEPRHVGGGIGCQVAAVATGAEGCVLARQAAEAGRPFALAFVDMGEQTTLEGLATVEQIWAECQDLQVVLCTAVGSDLWEERVLQLGWTDRLIILKKPVDAVEIRHVASALTHTWNLQQQALGMLGKLNQRVRDRTLDLERAHDDLLRANRELGAAKEAAEAASRAKTMFLANISHELRTPLTAILGYAEELRARIEEGTVLAADDDGLETIRRNALHLVGIIGDLLDCAKLEAGKLAVERTLCDARGVVEEVVALLQPKARAKGLPVELVLREPVPATIVSDPMRLRQILVNLVDNAIRFTDRGGVRVALATASTAVPRLVVEVCDDGCGIPLEVQQRLFRPFEQADQSTTRRFGGTGLGLAISRQFAGFLGGELTVESEPGRGSRFTLTVPIGTQAAGGNTPVAPTGAMPPVVVADVAGLRVLIVEDGLDNQRLIRSILARAGAATEIANDGAEGLERLCAAGADFDLVLMDIQMPVMDGLTATAALRAKGCRIPVVALTAGAMVGDRKACIAAGCDAFLTKPIDRRELVATIARLVRARG